MAKRNAGLGLSGTNPNSPFKPNDDDPNSIPVASENTGGLECAHADRRCNQQTRAAATMGVQPKAEPRGARLEGTARGASAEVMERYNEWRAKQATPQVAPQVSPQVVHESPPATSRCLQVTALMNEPTVQTYVAKSEAEQFLAQKTRVTIELADGIFTMPAVSVRQSSYCAVVLIPLRDDQSIFVPKPGTELTLVHKDDRLRVYFPGSYVEYPELGVAVMAFIKAEA